MTCFKVISGYLFRLWPSVCVILPFSNGYNQIALDGGKSFLILATFSSLYRLAETSDTYRRLRL